jgi:tripartite-type tricarboxylate transporter receptor subunit TctC
MALASLVIASSALAAQGRWEDIVRAAEKEGEVTVYATNSVGDLQVIWDGFKKKFPKIKLNAVGISTTSEIVTKVMAERRAGQFLVDVMLGSGELGRPYVAHPGMPPELTKALRDAFMKSMADPQLIADATKVNLEITPVSGEELTKIARDVINQPADVLDRIRKILAQ